MTIIATVLTIFFSYDEYKKGKMGARNYRIAFYMVLNWNNIFKIN